MREADLEKRIKERIEKTGGLCLKFTSPGFTGVPDRIALLPGGRCFFIEVKRPGSKDGMSPRQKRVACLLRGLGFEVIRASALQDVEEALAQQKETPR